MKRRQREEQEATVHFITLVNNILHSFFSNVEVYIINQQIYNSDGLYTHKCYISNNFMGTISEKKGVSHCKGPRRESLESTRGSTPESTPVSEWEHSWEHYREHYREHFGGFPVWAFGWPTASQYYDDFWQILDVPSCRPLEDLSQKYAQTVRLVRQIYAHAGQWIW